jgi:putative DNA primase/helicase
MTRITETQGDSIRILECCQSFFSTKEIIDMNNVKERVYAALSVIDAHEAFKRAINNTGLVAPEVIVNGRIMPFAGLNKQPGNKSARCFLFDDMKGGWFMDYSTGMFETWRSDSTKPFTKADCIAFKQQCDRDRIERDKQQATAQQQTAQKAAYIWQHAKPIHDQHDHQYLIKKGIQPHGARLYKGALVIPLFDQNRQLTNVQLIQADGTKRFLSGGKKKSCYWTIGEPTPRILIAEGFATAASLFEESHSMAVIAFDCGNLTEASKTVKAKHPNAEIIICGDNDLNGVGQKAARDAALAIGGKYLIPEIAGMDWNDVLGGHYA